MASKACAHERVGLAVDGKRVLRCTGNMVIPSTLCPDCDKWVPQVEVERIRTMRDVEQERLDERYAVKAESDLSFTLGVALILMIVLGAALAVLL